MLLLDAGDALVGDGLLGNRTEGEAVIKGMNLMSYDAMALGPKELSLGANLLRQRMEESRFAMLSANAVWRDSGEPVSQPYAILHVGPYRVGVIGLTRPPDGQLADFDVQNPQKTLARFLPEVVEGADTVLLLTNLPYQAALALADAVSGIDLVVAALPGQPPERAARAAQTGTLVVTAEQALPRHAGRRVGRLAVTLESDGSLGDESWVSVPMDRQFADDAEMTALLDQYR